MKHPLPLLLTFLAVVPLRAEEPPKFSRSPLFSGEELPERRASAKGHPELSEAKGKFVASLRALLDEGLPDPSGLPYRKIEIGVGNCWTGDSGIVGVEGWVIPHEPDKPAFAIGWNGQIYPVVADKGPADLAETVKACQNSKALFGPASWFHGEDSAVDGSQRVLFHGLYLTLLGFPDAAAKCLDEERPDMDDQTLVAMLADQWAWSFYDRAVCAHMRGDSALVLALLKDFKALAPHLAKKIEPGLDQSRGENTAFSWAEQLDEMEADNRRRIEAGVRTVPFDEKKFLEGNPDVPALVDAMSHIAVGQDGQPGSVALWRSPIVSALTKKGDEAVEPLLDCLASDKRLTQSVHFWREFAESRTVLGVQEAAIYALEELLHSNFFELGYTGDSLTSRPDEQRKELARKIREDWEKHGRKSGPERIYQILLDDSASPEQWATAASALFPEESGGQDGENEASDKKRPAPDLGGALRDRKDPSVSELLEKRIAGAAGLAGGGDEHALESAGTAKLQLLVYLDSWDAVRGHAAIERQVGLWLDGDAWKQESHSTLEQFISTTADKNPEVLKVFEAMAWKLALEDYSDFFAGDYVTSILRKYGDSPVLKHRPEELWTDPKSPWCLKQMAPYRLEQLIGGWRNNDLTSTEPFKGLLIKLLEDSSASEATVELDPDDAKKWCYQNGNSQATDALPENAHCDLKVGEQRAVRFMDLVGHALKVSRYDDENAPPVLEYYWPEAERDAWLSKLLKEVKGSKPEEKK